MKYVLIVLATFVSMQSMAMTGYVTRFSPGKGYGYIQPSSKPAGTNLFFHVQDILDGGTARDIGTGHCVEFSLRKNRNGSIQAVDLRIVDYIECEYERMD